jgi:polysaccharide chain length determinant protein (PEP-CTERM system associated)
MLDGAAVPRRSFDFEDYVDVIRRNIGWLIGPAFLGLVLSTAVAYLMPDTYVSHALIRIVPQQVPENLVQTAVNQQLADRINAMAETIKSRNSLQNVITTYGLYKGDLNKEPMDDVVASMRRDIKITPTAGVTNVNGRNLPAFQISFSYNDRRLAQRVCADLVGRFLNENAKTRIESAIATNDFLNDEFQKAKSSLETIETQLTDFRIKNAGHLPEEMQMNLAQMNALDNRLTGLNESLSRVSQEKMMLESQLQIARDRLASIRQATPAAEVRDTRIDELNKQIASLTTQLASLHDRYTDTYPDVINAKAQLAQATKERDRAIREKADQKSEAHSDPLPASKARLDAEARVQQVLTALRAVDMQAEEYGKEIASANASIKQYQARVETLPVGERQYNDLIRDRDLARQRYETLEMKRGTSAISMEMENRKQGEMLEVLDQASLPDAPAAPKRQLIIPLGVFAGFFVGLILVAIREVKDTSLKSLKDARLYTQLAVLGSVPLLENDLVVQRRRQIAWVGWAAALTVGLAVMAGSVAHYYLSKV